MLLNKSHEPVALYNGNLKVTGHTTLEIIALSMKLMTTTKLFW